MREMTDARVLRAWRLVDPVAFGDKCLPVILDMCDDCCVAAASIRETDQRTRVARNQVATVKLGRVAAEQATRFEDFDDVTFARWERAFRRGWSLGQVRLG